MYLLHARQRKKVFKAATLGFYFERKKNETSVFQSERERLKNVVLNWEVTAHAPHRLRQVTYTHPTDEVRVSWN